MQETQPRSQMRLGQLCRTAKKRTSAPQAAQTLMPLAPKEKRQSHQSTPDVGSPPREIWLQYGAAPDESSHSEEVWGAQG